ncbi:MAG: bifunctional tRNA (adenosine(37)-N6)-threonylcarbamoyltransferase complex dimerization subunit type 1 TsaB/HAD family hydrolase, partial [Candidatus Sumerlaeia bacterium]|nr:bifunctional tRNA (adenosine(37)-N6)-threonylcarbamoyltransferase complex dimerization subunit type 1 TsaB/HAD family hydrolase [Candidatus Sumerlaeia bacterium]
LVPERITTLENLLNEIEEKTVFCGEYITKIKEIILKRLGPAAIIANRASIPRRAFYLAELGRQRLERGDSDSVTTLQPLYLRRPPITERKHI